MIVDSEFMKDICRSLAFHAMETELTAQHVDDDDAADHYHKAVDRSVELIHQAGFNINELYPPNERPVAVDILSGKVTRP